MTMTITHLVRAESDEHKDGLRYRSVCSCGWAGAWQDKWDDAAFEGVDHRDDAMGPRLGIDLLCSALLRVRDDLADAVSWLAANWPSDLPAPELQGHHLGTERVTIEVQAETAENLARIAVLLGVEVGADRLDGYVSAFRRFGSVCLSAWLPTGEWRVEVAG
jgi:hypothetical protein